MSSSIERVGSRMLVLKRFSSARKAHATLISCCDSAQNSSAAPGSMTTYAESMQRTRRQIREMDDVLQARCNAAYAIVVFSEPEVAELVSIERDAFGSTEDCGGDGGGDRLVTGDQLCVAFRSALVSLVALSRRHSDCRINALASCLASSSVSRGGLGETESQGATFLGEKNCMGNAICAIVESDETTAGSHSPRMVANTLKDARPNIPMITCDSKRPHAAGEHLSRVAASLVEIQL